MTSSNQFTREVVEEMFSAIISDNLYEKKGEFVAEH